MKDKIENIQKEEMYYLNLIMKIQLNSKTHLKLIINFKF